MSTVSEPATAVPSLTGEQLLAQLEQDPKQVLRALLKEKGSTQEELEEQLKGAVMMAMMQSVAKDPLNIKAAFEKLLTDIKKVFMEEVLKHMIRPREYRRFGDRALDAMHELYKFVLGDSSASSS